MIGIFCLIVFIGGWMIFFAATVWVSGDKFIRFTRTFRSDLRAALESGDRLTATALVSRMILSVSLIAFIGSAVALLVGFAIYGDSLSCPSWLLTDFVEDVLLGENLKGLWLPFVIGIPIITAEAYILDSKERK